MFVRGYHGYADIWLHQVSMMNIVLSGSLAIIKEDANDILIATLFVKARLNVEIAENSNQLCDLKNWPWPWPFNRGCIFNNI